MLPPTVTADPADPSPADRPTLRDAAPATDDEAGRTLGLSTAAGDDTTTVAAGPAPPAAAPPRFLGDYEILSEIDRGGMGIVYRARQVRLGRVVALKLVRDPRWATMADLRRFQIEAEAVAQLDHPNIVPIYEVGQAGDQPYYSMKLIEGGNLARDIDRLKDDPRYVARLMLKVTLAVSYAHQHAILHRDLKPSNILLDGHDEPYVTDFGLAKRMVPGEQDTTSTLTGAVMGTPAYMPPEQARGGTKTLTTTADVYSLGATLYAMLTGQSPFAAGSVGEVLRLVLDAEPARPRSLNPKVDRDLETICLHCLEKDPARRYPSAEALAEDLEDWLAGRPVSVRPASAMERLTKWARRRPEIAALAATVLVVFVAGLAGVTWQWQNATIALGELKRSLYDADMQLGAQAFANGKFPPVEELVLAHTPRTPGGRDDLRGFEWHYLRAVSDPEPASFLAHKGAVLGINFSPDGALLATAGMDKVVRLWAAATGRAVRTLGGHADMVITLGFHPGGGRLVSGGLDRTARIWEVATGRTVRTFGPFPEAVTSAFFSSDGRTLVVACRDLKVRFFDPETGVERHREVLPEPVEKHFEAPEVVGHYNHSGSRLLLSLADVTWIFDGETGRILPDTEGEAANPVKGFTGRSRVFSPDDSTFMLHGHNTLTIHDARSGRVVDRLPDEGHFFEIIQVGETSNLVAAASVSSGIIRLWDLPGRRELRTLWLPRNASGLRNGLLSLSPDSRTLAFGDFTGQVRLWYNLLGDKVTTLRVGPSSPAGRQQLHGMVLDPSGRTLAVAAHDGTVTLVDVRSRSILRSLKGPDVSIYGAAYSADGKALATGSADGHVRVWNTADDTLRHDLAIPRGQAFAVAFDPSGPRLAAGADDGSLTAWDAASGKVVLDLPRVHEAAIHGVAFSPRDGSIMATAGADQTVQLRDARSGRLVRTLRSDPSRSDAGPFRSVAFSPDGREVVAACSERVAVVWDARSGSVRHTLTGHVAGVRQATFSPDGKRVITAGQDGSIKIWDAVLGTETFELRHGAPLAAAILTPDGYQLIASGWDGVLTFWDGTPVAREGAFAVQTPRSSEQP
ncbi:MAG TPA: serine/threonine-protein kinase [Isosphaeraceae bacterium]